MELITYTEILPNGFSFPMRLVPGGVFDIESGEKGIFGEVLEPPKHFQINVAPFYLAVHLVTQELWQAVMGEKNNPSHFIDNCRPVENVSWFEAKEFIYLLNNQTEAHRKTQGVGMYRLPNEAEWEFAARGGQINDTYRFSGSDKLLDVGWFSENSDNETHEVGLLLPNQLGLFDMNGNVYEWMEDRWGVNYQNALTNRSNWLTDDSEALRVLRGGGYFFNEQNCRVVSRAPYMSSRRYDYVGFRLALSTH